MFDKSYMPEEIVRMDATYQIHRAVNKYGLERTEDKVKELYGNNIGLTTYLLGILHDFWRKKI